MQTISLTIAFIDRPWVGPPLFFTPVSLCNSRDLSSGLAGVKRLYREHLYCNIRNEREISIIS